LDGRGRDANVKRSAGIAKPNHGDAAKLETQGGAEPRFAATKGSADAGHKRKQQSWAEKPSR
jgi:hypothetical protein